MHYNFRDRDRYVQGDYRFRYGYCKHNPRKMVKTWAEKEMRNLMRYVNSHSQILDLVAFGPYRPLSFSLSLSQFLLFIFLGFLIEEKDPVRTVA